MDLDALVAVEHPSGEHSGLGQTIDKRTKADALHYSSHVD
jgi:hypothetical protein